MIARFIATMVLMACSSSFAGSPRSGLIQKPCREHPQLAGKCFNVRGRLSVYNGSPAMRLWRVGTRRVLGISEQRFSLPDYRNLPEELASQLNSENEIYGDFLVCPFTRPK